MVLDMLNLKYQSISQMKISHREQIHIFVCVCKVKES